jgi:glycosyltransferase involved in cell wall biosynthesis
VTTFIDFRYAKSISSVLLPDDQQETALVLDPKEENYIGLVFSLTPDPRKLLRVTNEHNQSVTSVMIEGDKSLSIRDADGQTVLKTPAGSLQSEKNNVIAFRLGPKIAGLKLRDTILEKEISFLNNGTGRLYLEFDDIEGSVRILGYNTGRSKQWAKLYYHRLGSEGLGVELVFDWHHLCSGIPLSGTMTTERLIEQGNYRLMFRSFVLDEEVAPLTDFAMSFSATGDADISLHITPPLYTRLNSETPNIGLFVCESLNVMPSIVARCNMMDSIIVPSGFASKAYRRSGVTCPIHIVPHGVDVDFYAPATKRTPLPRGRGFNFLAISTLVERKNIRHLVRAFLEEFRENEDVALFLFLRPEYNTTQNNVALEFDAWEKRYFLKSAPIFLGTGYLTRETLRDFYANADAYVMPSNEGFGLTLLEAMASGTPVIALNYGGVLDFINEENGYLVPTGGSFIANDMIEYAGDRFFEPDLKKLRAAMRRVFENREEAYKKGLKGRRNCEENYSWAKTAIELSKVIEKTYKSHKEKSKTILESEELKKKPTTLSWVLCVPDDMPISSAIKYLKYIKNVNTEVLCLFTRYARFEDIIRARQNGFLFHRWDGTQSNCKAIIQRVILTPWVGILYPNEKIVGSLERLFRFLETQPKEVYEILVLCPDSANESRFSRSRPVTSKPENRIFHEISISIS